jgi:hypothetical protein
MDVRLPNGKLIKNVPAGTTKKEIAYKAVQAGLAKPEDFYPDNSAELQSEARRGVVDSMSGLQKFGAGIGQGITDLGYGIGQAVGLVDQDTVRDKARTDSALMGTGLGKTGAVVGQIGAAVPAAFIPGANSAVGATLIGAGLGAAAPVAEGDVLQGKALSGAVGAAAGLGGHLLGKAVAGKVGQKIAARQLQKSQNAGRDAVLNRGMQLGYSVEPTLANPTLTNRTVEGFAGKLTTAQMIAEKNQAVTNTIAKKAIGLADDSPLDEAALQSVRAQAGQAYEAVKQIPGRVSTNAKYHSDLQNIAKPFRRLAADVPEEAGEQVEKLIERYSKDSFDPANVVEIIRRRRATATTLFKAYDDPVKQELARVHRGIADALEDNLEWNLRQRGTPQLLQQFKDARQLIAKTHTIEAALNEGSGNVVASKLASQLAKGKPLSGELKDVAKFAQAFPKSVQEIKSSMPGMSPLDWAVAGGTSAGTGNPAFLGMVAARPLVRNAITSGMYQRAMVPPSYSPGITNQLVRSIGRGPLSTVAPAVLSVDAVQK